MNCTNQQPPQLGVAVPNLVWVGLKWLLAFPRVPVITGTPLTQTIFLPCSPLNDRRSVARILIKIGLFSLFSCLSLARLLLLLMSDNIHPNPCPVFPCLVCAGNVIWAGRSVQCCTSFNWVPLMCSLLSFSRLRILGSSHSWSYPTCCVPDFFEDPTLTSTVISSLDSSSWYTYTAQSGPLLLMQHSHPILAFIPLIHFLLTLYLLSLCTLTTASYSWLFLFTSCFLFPSLTPSGFVNGMLRVSEPGALNCYTFFRFIPLTLFVSRNPKVVIMCYVLFIFILHSRESELYRYILDGKPALTWELPFLRRLGHLSST